MSRRVIYYAFLAVSAVGVIVLPYPDYSGHGTIASVLALVAALSTIGSTTLAIMLFRKDKSIAANLEVALALGISPFFQILLTALLGENLGFEDLSGVTWYFCGWLSELCTILLFIGLTVRAVRRR